MPARRPYHAARPRRFRPYLAWLRPWEEVCIDQPRKRGEGAASNPQKLRRLEAGAADQSAVHVGDRHQLPGVRWLYGAAIKDADALSGRRKPRREPLADEAMDLGHVGRCRGEPGADRPYRLIGDHKVLRGRAVGNRAFKLRADHRKGTAADPVVTGLPDAQDGKESGPPRRLGLASHLGVALAVECTALGMTDDHGVGAEIGQHLS